MPGLNVMRPPTPASTNLAAGDNALTSRNVKAPSNVGRLRSPPNSALSERKTTTLRTGDRAPDFTLPDLKKTREVKLSSFHGKKPVVLIFGSYT